MKLEDIGFYTLEDKRAKQTSLTSPMWRCELILTDACNFKCPYCRDMRSDCAGTKPFDVAMNTLELWCKDGLKNVRFSGGEPTLYEGLDDLVSYAKANGVERIAISTNGSAKLDYYKHLINLGVNDLSISLDACCSSFGDEMAGVEGAWDILAANLKVLAKLTYVTVGVVLTEETIDTVPDIVKFAHELEVSDIRVISSAQFDETVEGFSKIDSKFYETRPILKYRVENHENGRGIRGLQDSDTNKCHLVKDDSAIAGDFHFPCIIYFREQGKAIGKVGPDMRKERHEWFSKHNSHADPICKQNCLDVCIDYNNKAESFAQRTIKVNKTPTTEK
jgi:molybdenum cofactor biosynthesis enzyme MoaA